jgi:hypothetical protein
MVVEESQVERGQRGALSRILRQRVERRDDDRGRDLAGEANDEGWDAVF